MAKKKLQVASEPVSASPVPVAIKKNPDGLAFPDAIKALIGGAKIHRKEWGDNGEYGVLKDSFLMIHRNDQDHTWIVSEGDLLAIDWVIL